MVIVLCHWHGRMSDFFHPSTAGESCTWSGGWGLILMRSRGERWELWFHKNFALSAEWFNRKQVSALLQESPHLHMVLKVPFHLSKRQGWLPKNYKLWKNSMFTGVQYASKSFCFHNQSSQIPSFLRRSAGLHHGYCLLVKHLFWEHYWIRKYFLEC